MEAVVGASTVQLLLRESQHTAGDVPRVKRRPEHGNPTTIGAQVPTADLELDTSGQKGHHGCDVSSDTN